MAGGDSNKRVWFVCAYVCVVLLVDTLAANNVRWDFSFGDYDYTIQWSKLSWRGDGAWAQFDFFKLFFWLIIPLALCFWEMDWGYFGFTRWKRADVYLLLGMIVLGIACVLAIKYIPQLRAYYPSAAHMSRDEKWTIFYQTMLWN